MQHRRPRGLVCYGLLLGAVTAAGGCREPGPLDVVIVDMGGAEGPADRQRPGFTRGAPDRLLLRGQVVRRDGIENPGEVLVVGDRIRCVARSCAAEPDAQGATVLYTAGIIYPGLVDAHNHTQYNYLPPWKPSRRYTSRYQWGADAGYSEHVRSVRAFERTHECQQVKYGEVRALVGGATTIQGTGNINRRCYRTLVRNAEHGNELGPDRMRTNTLSISSVTDAEASALAGGMQRGDVTAYMVHLAEGTDEASRQEFQVLAKKGLLQKATVVIHGTALGQAEFAELAQAGGKLVWSPSSNLALYGRTTNVPAALDAGLRVALAPDWTVSGSPSILHELKVASRVSREEWAGRLSSRMLFEMVSSEAAEAMALGDVVGSLKPGLLADILVLTDTGKDPYVGLVEAGLADVALVIVGGRLRYGDPRLMDAVEQDRCEPMAMCGTERRICVPDTDDPRDTLNEDLSAIRTAIKSFYDAPYPFDLCE